MLLFEQFESKGYKKAGNWYMHTNISINLFTKEMKSTNKKIVFHYIFEKNIDVELVEKTRMFIDSLAQY